MKIFSLLPVVFALTLSAFAQEAQRPYRIWVEKVKRRGTEVTVTMREAIWQGNYFKTFTYYGVLAVNLGSLPADTYTVKWVLVFSKFDGDGRPFAKNGIPQNWPADPVKGGEPAKAASTQFGVTP